MIKLVWQEGARWRKRFFFTRDGALKYSRRFSATNVFLSHRSGIEFIG